MQLHVASNCRNCGARLPASSAPVIECEYCHDKTVLRGSPVPLAMPPQRRSRGRGALIAGAALSAIIIGIAASRGGSTHRSSSTSTLSVTSTTNVTLTESSTQVKSATPPAIGKAVLAFGEAGTNAGQFTGARALAVVPSGEIVVAEASSGRVQVFDAKGAYQRLITLPPSALTKELSVFGAGAGPSGQVVISRAGDLLVLDIAAGKVTRTIRGSYPDRFYHGDVEVVPDGTIYAITDHTGDLAVVHVSPAGKVLGRTAKVDVTNLAVDGLGTMFLAQRFDGVVDVRDAKGAVVRKFSQGNPARGKLSSAGPIAIDGRGHVFVAEGSRVVIFDTEGAFVAELDVGTVDDLALDREGRLYVLGDSRITKYELALPSAGA